MVEFKHFSFQYEGGKTPALKNICLKIERGQCIVVAGLSGCGKSTLLRIINGLCPSVYPGKAEGIFRLENQDWLQNSAAQNAKYVGSILQNAKGGFLLKEPEDECKFSAQCLQKNKEEIDSIYAQLAPRHPFLFANDNVLHLSSGESQILSGLSQRIKMPSIVVMDEPSANLDAKEINRLREMIQELKAAHITLIIAEHRLHYLEGLYDSFVFMADGEITRPTPTWIGADAPMAHGSKKFFHTEVVQDYLNVAQMSCKIKKKIIFNPASFCLESGLVTAVIGVNGCGKSSFGKVLCGLIKDGKKQVTFNQVAWRQKDILQNTYFCMQEAHQQMVCASVAAEIQLQCPRLSEIQIEALLQRLDLHPLILAHPSKLSGGQVQRLAILLAYVSNAKIVVLDEPTSGLDYIHMLQVSQLINQMAAQGRFVLLISHDKALLSHTADCYLWIENQQVHSPITLSNEADFDTMMERMKARKEHRTPRVNQVKSKPIIHPLVNILVFFAMANALFLYPTTRSSIYLMGLLLGVMLANLNFKDSIRMILFYGVLGVLKEKTPPYQRVILEIFVLRGGLVHFAFRNVVHKVRTLHIIEALSQAKVTDYVVIPIISMLRLLPTLQHDASCCVMGLKTRKLIRHPNPIQAWRYFVVPLIFSLLRSAEALACGIETKGMAINQKRTWLTAISFRPVDGLWLILFFSGYIFLFLGGL